MPETSDVIHPQIEEASLSELAGWIKKQRKHLLALFCANSEQAVL